jgi:putative oxidoreductase
MYALDKAIASKTGDAALLLGRLLIFFTFVPGGFNKMTNPAGFAKYLEGNGVPMSNILAPIAGAVEFFGGLAVVLGFHTRVSALVMILFIVTATWIAHRWWLFPAAQQAAQYQAFMKNLTMIAGLLFLMKSGAGKYSLDHWFGAKH